MTANEYLKGFLLGKAKLILQNTVKVNFVTNNMGLISQNNFSKYLKIQFDLTPREYKKPLTLSSNEKADDTCLS